MPLLRHIRDAARQIAHHPLTKDHQPAAWSRWLRWQLSSRLAPGPIVIPFTSCARLLASPSMHGATSNYYTGLSEFEEMAFLLHALRPEDFFLDIGANIGAYSILASSVVGARSMAFEPDAAAFDRLNLNIRINEVDHLVSARRNVVGRESGTVSFTSDLDSLNYVLPSSTSSATACVSIDAITLDGLLWAQAPCVVKIDTEGFESEVIAGGSKLIAEPDVQAIIIEIEHSRRYGIAPESVFEQICDSGFSPCHYEPVTRTLSKSEPRFTGEGSNVIFLKDFDWARDRCSNAPRFSVLGMDI